MTRNSRPKVGIISLGCPRNLVDSEVLLGILENKGYEITELREADTGIVNTCAFIDEAKEESINTILELIELKKKKKLSSVIVAGCLPQRYGKALLKAFPGVNAFIGCDGIEEIDDVLKGIAEKKKLCKISAAPSFIRSHTHPRFRMTPRHYAYVKISEGCKNRCSFCIIPSIKGAYRSRPIESVLKEVDGISRKGRLSEINLIGQDTTLYGTDNHEKRGIKELLERLCDFDAHRRWIRLLYMYPAHIDDELIDIFAREDSICKYIDLPLQHINDSILRSMNRAISKRNILELIKKIRGRVPHVSLRTSLIVGFPGEGEEEFRELVEFVKEIKFERMGVFTYSREEGTPAYNFKNQISEDLKLERLNTLMSIQKEIAGEGNKSYLGRTVEVLLDEKDENSEGLYVGRTQGDAPEVDGEVFVKARNVKPGDFINVKITDTLEYDLVGEQAA